MSKIKWQLASKETGGAHIYTVMDAMLMWRIEATLLQSHRALFLTTSSILLSASAVLFSLKGTSDFGTIAFLHLNLFSLVSLALAALGVVVVGLWKKVASKRTELLHFCQFLVVKIEQGEKITGVMETSMKFEKAPPEKRAEFLEPFLREKYADQTRTIIDISRILNGIPTFIHWVFVALIVLNLLEMILGQA